MYSVPRAVAVAGAGLRGDRYGAGIGTFSSRFEVVPGARALSLLDTQALRRCNERLGYPLSAATLRRNLLIEGLDLMALRGYRLSMGDVRIDLVGACPPCRYLSRLVDADMRHGLGGIGGMRARIVSGGVLVTGMAVAVGDPSVPAR